LRAREVARIVPRMDSAYRDSGRDLGPLVSVHTDRGGCVLWVIFLFGAACLSTWALFSGIPTFVAVLMVAVIAIGIGALRWISRKSAGHRIELYERALVAHTREGKRVIELDDVRSVTSSSSRQRAAGVETQRHVVEARDGTRIAFSLMHDRAPDLLAAIHARTAQRLRTDALRAFDAGETLRFGPFALSDEGLGAGDAPTVPWSDIEHAAVEMPAIAIGAVRSEVKVWKKNESRPFATEASEKVPNANVMLEVVALAVEAEAGDAT
jgi:hypothetical protein